MQRIGAILLFYRPLFLWSVGVNIGMTIIYPNIWAALITKLALTFFTWHFLSLTNARRKIVLFRNLGIKPAKLFVGVYLIDAAFSLIYFLLVKEFI